MIEAQKMTDPLTMGAFVASALAHAGEAAIKGAVGEAVKDIYKALKDKILGWADRDADRDMEALEKSPRSRAREAVVAEIVDSLPTYRKEALRALAEDLLVELKRGDRTNIGLDLKRSQAEKVELGDITVTQGTGARIDEVKVLDSLRTGNIVVRGSPRRKRRSAAGISPPAAAIQLINSSVGRDTLCIGGSRPQSAKARARPCGRS
jgi:hypothetical protein